MGNINMKVKFEGYKQFDKALKEYRKWSNKQPSEIINSKLFFIARNATNTTKTADKGKIRSELNESSKEYKGVPLAAILVNRDLGRKGKKGLFGAKMVKAVEKFINKATSRTNFLRACWLPAIRILEAAVKRGDIAFTRRYSPKQATGLKQYGMEKGGATYAKNTSFRCWGEIVNSAGQGKQASPTVTKILVKGLQDAVSLEVQSMFVYIQRKYDAAHKQYFARKF